jgi:hypothetical protein
MPSISSCPACHRDLTIPDLAEHRQPLRCPLCDAQFDAEQVLADSVNFPPLAIVLGSDNPPENPPKSSLDDALESPKHEPLPPESSGQLRADLAQDRPVDDIPDRAAKAEAEDIPDQHADVDPSSDEYESFGRQAAGMRVAPPARRKSSPLAALGQLLGMAIGGILGLAIGYYVLVWIGGPRADFLELRRKVPRWFVPPVRRHKAAVPSAPLFSPGDGHSGSSANSLDGFRPQSDFGEQRHFSPAPSVGDDAPLPLAASQKPQSPSQPAVAVEPSSTAPQENRLVERLPPDPKPLPESYHGPRGFHLQSAADLQAALDGADRALRCPHCQAPSMVRLTAFAPAVTTESGGSDGAVSDRPCDYCRGKQVLNLTVATFEQLCELAETVTFVKFDAEDPSRDRCRDSAEAILLAIGGDRDKSEIVGRLAGARLDDKQRESNGILLAGIVQQTRQEGELFAIQVLLFGCGRSVTVISRRPPTPPVANRDCLLVLGSIVDRPQDNLAGYTGDRPQVVWGGLPLKLPNAAR